MIQSHDALASSLSLSQTSSDIRFGDMNPAVLCRHRRLLTQKEYSVWLIIRKLEQVATHWNATLFQLVYGSLFTVQSVYFHIWNCSWNYKPSGVRERGFSRTVKLCENCDLTVLPVISYIYLFGRIYASCLSYFSNCPSGIGQKLNWRDIPPISFYHVQTVGA